VSQFYWWRKAEYPEKTTDLPQVTVTLSHNIVWSTPRLSRIQTHNVSDDRHWNHIRKINLKESRYKSSSYDKLYRIILNTNQPTLIWFTILCLCKITKYKREKSLDYFLVKKETGLFIYQEKEKVLFIYQEKEKGLFIYQEKEKGLFIYRLDKHLPFFEVQMLHHYMYYILSIMIIQVYLPWIMIGTLFLSYT
jgi:hypothetical protein